MVSDAASGGVRQTLLPWLLGMGWLIIVLALAGAGIPAFRAAGRGCNRR